MLCEVCVGCLAFRISAYTKLIYFFRLRLIKFPLTHSARAWTVCVCVDARARALVIVYPNN